jgi:hypothetical protein
MGRRTGRARDSAPPGGRSRHGAAWAGGSRHAGWGGEGGSCSPSAAHGVSGGGVVAVCDAARGATDTTRTSAGLAWGDVGGAGVCAEQQAGPRVGRRPAPTTSAPHAQPTCALQPSRASPLVHQRRVTAFCRGLAGGVWPDPWAAAPGPARPPPPRLHGSARRGAVRERGHTTRTRPRGGSTDARGVWHARTPHTSTRRFAWVAWDLDGRRCTPPLDQPSARATARPPRACWRERPGGS